MDEIPKWGKRRERENEGEIEACCFWPQKVVERGRRGDRGKRASDPFEKWGESAVLRNTLSGGSSKDHRKKIWRRTLHDRHYLSWVPSNRFFSDFISCEAEKRKIKISALDFRDKKYGWGLDGSVAGKDLNDAEVEGVVNPDTESYYHYFFDGEISRDCCYQCPYAQRQRVGDITIGDY